VQTLDFIKMESAGNDFVMLNALELPELDWAALSRWLCRKHFGVGADGLMLIRRSRQGGHLVRMFNPDGSEDVCGNGTLCAAVLLHEDGMVEGRRFELESIVGKRQVCINTDSAGNVTATVDMGRARFEPDKIPARFEGDSVLERTLRVDGEEFKISCVSTGTTHTLIFSDALPDDDYFLRWAPRVDVHPLFPERTSISWVVVESPERVRVRIWERGGVDESLSCGTGACAVAAVGARLGLTEKRLEVFSRGGLLTVELDDQEHAWLTGKPRTLFKGAIPLPERLPIDRQADPRRCS